MIPIEQVFMLAAGLGNRLRPWTEQQAKPSISFLGLPLGIHPLVHCLEFLPLDLLVYNTHHLPESVQRTYNSIPLAKTKRESHEKNLLGSFGGLVNAVQENLIKKEKSLLVMNADEVFIPAVSHFMAEFLDAHLQSHADMTLLLTAKKEKSEKGGVWVDTNRRVLHARYNKQPDFLDSNGLHFLGIYLIQPTCIASFCQQGSAVRDLIDDFLLPGIQSQTIKVASHTIDALYYEAGEVDLFLESETQILNDKNDKQISEWLDRVHTVQGLIKEPQTNF